MDGSILENRGRFCGENSVNLFVKLPKWAMIVDIEFPCLRTVLLLKSDLKDSYGNHPRTDPRTAETPEDDPAIGKDPKVVQERRTEIQSFQGSGKI